MIESYLTGLLVCGGIIIAIGAQNAYVLGQSIRREHHWWSAGLCMTSDVILFTLGMFGVSAALMAMPQALEILRWLGVAFLGWLAVQALVRAGWGRAALETDNATQQEDATSFVAGASSASVIWFSGLAWFGSTLAPILSKPAAWRVIDGLIGLIMAAIALQLAIAGL